MAYFDLPLKPLPFYGWLLYRGITCEYHFNERSCSLYYASLIYFLYVTSRLRVYSE
jgi:hypothetical protein